jgi:hypothetical protein
MQPKLKRFALAAIVVGLISGAARARPATTGGEPEPPPVYELQLVYIFETPEPEFVFVIGNSGFKTVAGLEDFLASRPRGTTLRWSPGCVRLGGEPLLSSENEMEEFKAFCVEHGIDFVLVPSG